MKYIKAIAIMSFGSYMKKDIVEAVFYVFQ